MGFYIMGFTKCMVFPSFFFFYLGFPKVGQFILCYLGLCTVWFSTGFPRVSPILLRFFLRFSKGQWFSEGFSMGFLAFLHCFILSFLRVILAFTAR